MGGRQLNLRQPVASSSASGATTGSHSSFPVLVSRWMRIRLDNRNRWNHGRIYHGRVVLRTKITAYYTEGRLGGGYTK